MSRLVRNPAVFVVASSVLDPDGLDDWTKYNDLEGLAQDGKSPLSLLMHDEGEDMERLVEFAGRHCYRSWAQGRARESYIHNLIQMEHGSVFEHSTISFAIQGVSRSLSHELVRHRVGIAISQESQRYVEASDMRFVVPPLHCYIAGDNPEHPVLARFEAECLRDLEAYQKARHDLVSDLMGAVYQRKEFDSIKSETMTKKRINEAARAHLPNAAETRLTWTANIRTLRHFLLLRGGAGADLEIRRLACLLLEVCKDTAPAFFLDMRQVDGDFGVGVIERISVTDI